MVTRIGLDLGYANITLSDSLAEIYREPAVALVHKEPKADSRRTISIGSAALDAGADGTDVPDGVLVRPFKNGMLFDHQLTREIVHSAIAAVGDAEKIRCIVGVPSDFLPKQERELAGMLAEAGVSTTMFVSRPVAALIGAGYSPTMSVISVNIGAMSTEVAIIRKGEIIQTARDNIGGEDFDKAVKQYIYDQGDVNVSLSVARAIKEKLGAVWKGKPNETIDIEGTLALTGNTLNMTLATEDIVGVFEQPLQKLMMMLVGVINKIPAAAVEEILANGIVLTGGGAELFGIEMLMSKVLGITVTKPEGAIDCVAKGLSRVNSFVPLKVKADGKNITSKLAGYYENGKK